MYVIKAVAVELTKPNQPRNKAREGQKIFTDARKM
jgi:hypothetical protein